MRTEPLLMERGIDVVESDLGERILQLMHLEPSHIVLPAIHINASKWANFLKRKWVRRKETSTRLT